jgi:type I restriction enzyme S subunit
LFLADLRNGSFLEKSLAPFDILELNQVADLNWGDMQTTKSAYQSDGYVTYSAAGPDGFMKTYDYDGDGIVLSAIGAECGKTWLASGKWSCIKNTMRIFTLNESKIAIRYLFWITNAKSVWPKRGSAQPFISQEDARKIKLNVPNIDFQLKTLTFIDEIVEAANFVVKEHSTLTKLRDAAYSTIFEVSRDA